MAVKKTEPVKKTKTTTTKKPVAKSKKVATVITSSNKGRGRPPKHPPKEPRPVEAKPLGTPTEYRKEYDALAFKYCLLGATDAVLGDFFGVSEQTINNWKKAFPSFFESVSRGKDRADAEIANSFYMRAKGFTHKVEKPMVVATGNYESKIEIAKYNETVLADANACYKWLHNRQAKLWPDKQNIDFGNLPAIGVLLNLPDDYVYAQDPAKDHHDDDGSGE